MAQIKILFLGDIVGKIGRKAVTKILPKLKKQYQPDFVVANAENLSHGKGISKKTLDEMLAVGIDFFTSGNHVWQNDEAQSILADKKYPIIRPANYPDTVAGDGYRIINIGVYQILFANLLGQAFFTESFANPITTLENILQENEQKKIHGIFVDFHAEATSEKQVLGHYFDGKINALVGTHTHIQTADEKILPKGTAFITDAGMCGFAEGSLGVDLKNVTKKFLTQISTAHEIPEHGSCQVNGIFVIIKPEIGKAIKIERISESVDV
ncbi:MAG: TIGR00282 family metallophosphoesterase [Patescibacteria group bacterium]